ncbi:carnitine O-palmitoyltransferase 1, liver isoform-like [Biomphalaria glabrata]|uniref:Carnitine O-palmitoyltransferase 1, liver isoform-like n=1 Tax=Biomphalaria glabrata TaxID=6526 RepID=A0A9W2YLA6_BIOGL|nr:carnitine O-palmitoyltransferase 1, liver isoform-like [Biomphalaria glabrata]XP_055863430.1 carnitine O-palmitoyltransferase 1, liver isoform-like [Biomphalaria glabrata]
MDNIKSWSNKVNDIIWPGSVLNVLVIVSCLSTIRFSHFSLLHPLKLKLQVIERVVLPSNESLAIIAVLASCGIVLFAVNVLVRRLALRILLARRFWMYELPNQKSLATWVWGVIVKSLGGWKLSTYCYQSCLPSLPVPPLGETLNRLIISLQPLYADDPEKLKELEEEAKTFKKTLGTKAQALLTLRSWYKDNYIDDWWEKYIYLMSRSPLANNSNYYIMDHCYWTPTTKACARGASSLYQILCVREMILSGTLEPLTIRQTVPVCMEQYRRIFSTTRIPGEEVDTIQTYPASKSQHIIVSRRGLLYRVEILDKNGNLIGPCGLQKLLEWIVEDADLQCINVSEFERSIPVLTSMDRTQWAKTRQEFFSDGINRESLNCVESAILFLFLDTEAFSDLSSRASHLIHGRAGQFWFDKSLQLIVMADGHMGLNCEHSYADAPVVAHVIEYNFTYEILSELYDSEGNCTDIHKNGTQENLKCSPSLLQWEVNSKLSCVIDSACKLANKNNTDLDLLVCDHEQFGKGAIKKCKMSPDAFIQMAVMTTHRKLTGQAALVYESSMTRLYKKGRTETVRSLTKEANDFIVNFLSPEVSKQEKRRLLSIACDKHSDMYKDAMNGRGIDRHLFALYIACRGLGKNPEFLKKYLSIPWTLSTSQQPQQQISWAPSCTDLKFSHLLCPGGGFGPVVPDGYGISYMVPGDHRIFFHVSSWKSSDGTNSAQFMQALIETMKELKDLFADS